MKKILVKERILFLIIYGLSFITSAFLIKLIYPIHLQDQKPLFFDLIELNVNLPFWLIYFLGSINIFLIWIIAKKFFLGRLALIPVLVYCFSPWSFYLMASQSFYIYLLMLTLITFLGILLIKSEKSKLGILWFILGTVLALYSSLLLLMIYPILIAGLILIKFISIKKISTPIFIIVLLCLPLFIAMFKNQVGIKNIYNNQITVFADPGHINIINTFQGESSKAGFNLLSRMAENKYIYFFKYSILKAVKHITPSTFFTSQEGLLKFSFSPPIYFGFLTPFLYGLYLILNSSSMRKYLAVSLILLIPSFLSREFVDLNRLVLFEPVIIFIIALGLVEIIKGKKDRIFKFMLLLTIILVVTQLLVTIFDINFREYARYERYFGGSLQIGEQ